MGLYLYSYDSAAPTSVQGQIAIGDLSLDGGGLLQNVHMAWQASDAVDVERPAILLLHGYSNSHLFWQWPSPADLSSGWGNALVGPGKAIDTRKYLVISINHLGSCYGSTGPSATNEESGSAYGLSFPEISVRDQAKAAVLALRTLGIRRLASVIGYSYGGYIAFQLAIDEMFPHDTIVALASAPKGNGSRHDCDKLRDLALNPLPQTLRQLRNATLKTYGLSSDNPAVRTSIEHWAQKHHPVSLLRLREAAMRFDRRHEVAAIGRPFFWLHVFDDALFPPPPREALHQMAPRRLCHCVIPTGGHLAPLANPHDYSDKLRRFLEGAHVQSHTPTRTSDRRYYH